jgi:hypothetical protein
MQPDHGSMGRYQEPSVALSIELTSRIRIGA